MSITRRWQRLRLVKRLSLISFKLCPFYTLLMLCRVVVACRTPSIGVGGSTLCGGYSWLSGEYGCVSDPANLLDAQVVKLDGTVKWASEEPDLLWALRGTIMDFAGTSLIHIVSASESLTHRVQLSPPSNIVSAHARKTSGRVQSYSQIPKRCCSRLPTALSQ